MNKKPRYYYGYAVVIASAIMMIATWGSYYSYSIFFNSLLAEFNWTSAVTSGVFSIAILVAGLLGLVAGRISDRLGPKAVSIFCGICLGLGFILMSLVNSPWQVYLLYGILLAAGIGGLWPAVISTVARWFGENRGLMIGIVTAGMGMGTVIFSPLTSHFVSAYGWRTAYVITGIIVLVIVVFSAQFLRRKPDQTYPASQHQEVPRQGSQPEHRDSAFKRVTRTKQFWILATVYFLSGFSQLAVMVHIVPYTTGLGIPPIAASSILAVIGAANIFGRIIMGVINDRIRVKPLLIFIIASLLVSLSWLEFTGKLWTFYIFGIIFGFAWGGSSTLQTLVMVELFGLTSLGELVADLGVCACAGGALGPVATGYIFDVTGSYKLAFLVCAIAALVALLSILWLTPLRNRQEIYRPDSNT